MFLSRAPLIPKNAFDLHALGTPPAFVLSQDQTRRQVTEVTACATDFRSGSTVTPLLVDQATNVLTVTKKKSIDAWNVLRTQHPSVGKVQFGDKKSAGLFY